MYFTILLATFDFFRRLSISDEGEVCESRRNVAVSGTSPGSRFNISHIPGLYPPGHSTPLWPPMGVYYFANPNGASGYERELARITPARPTGTDAPRSAYVYDEMDLVG